MQGSERKSREEEPNQRHGRHRGSANRLRGQSVRCNIWHALAIVLCLSVTSVVSLWSTSWCGLLGGMAVLYLLRCDARWLDQWLLNTRARQEQVLASKPYSLLRLASGKAIVHYHIIRPEKLTRASEFCQNRGLPIL